MNELNMNDLDELDQCSAHTYDGWDADSMLELEEKDDDLDKSDVLETADALS